MSFWKKKKIDIRAINRKKFLINTKYTPEADKKELNNFVVEINRAFDEQYKDAITVAFLNEFFYYDDKLRNEKLEEFKAKIVDMLLKNKDDNIESLGEYFQSLLNDELALLQKEGKKVDNWWLYEKGLEIVARIKEVDSNFPYVEVLKENDQLQSRSFGWLVNSWAESMTDFCEDHSTTQIIQSFFNNFQKFKDDIQNQKNEQENEDEITQKAMKNFEDTFHQNLKPVDRGDNSLEYGILELLKNHYLINGKINVAKNIASDGWEYLETEFNLEHDFILEYGNNIYSKADANSIRNHFQKIAKNNWKHIENELIKKNKLNQQNYKDLLVAYDIENQFKNWRNEELKIWVRDKMRKD